MSCSQASSNIAYMCVSRLPPSCPASWTGPPPRPWTRCAPLAELCKKRRAIDWASHKRRAIIVLFYLFIMSMTNRAVVTAAPCSPSLAAALQTVCVSLRPLSPPTVGIVTFLQPSYPGPQPSTTPCPGHNWNNIFISEFVSRNTLWHMIHNSINVCLWNGGIFSTCHANYRQHQAWGHVKA